ncbi:hypothetical protein RZS08_42685, partial [Arthrospira platensis SPKY1]|nr:hypothetical protein [Arthrospira platensis SPKY1]
MEERREWRVGANLRVRPGSGTARNPGGPTGPHQGGHVGPPLRNPPVRLQSGRTRRSAPTESAGSPPIRADPP